MKTPSYDIILFDADDTLFDFQKCERSAFDKVMADCFPQTDEVYASFRKINLTLWQCFEQGQISKEAIPVERFTQLAEVWNKNWDCLNVGHSYLDYLSQERHLVPQALEICETLAQYATLGLVTNGISRVQHSRLKGSELETFVSVIVVSEDCGYAKPDRRIFHHALSQLPPTTPERVLVVGDRLDVDVLGAQAAGLKSCWYNPAKIKNAGNLLPDHEIDNLQALITIVGGT